MTVYRSKVQKCVNSKFKNFLVLLFREYMESEGDDTVQGLLSRPKVRGGGVWSLFTFAILALKIRLN